MLGQRQRPWHGAIGNSHRCRMFVEQRTDHTARRTARAEQQDTFASDRITQIHGHIANQTPSVLSPTISSALKTSVLTAPASSARGVSRVAN